MRRSVFTPEQALALTTTAKCLWCDWHTTGTVQETSEKARQHRAKQHPEAQPKRRRKRHRNTPQLSDKTVEQNIALVREQGGATWATEGDM